MLHRIHVFALIRSELAEARSVEPYVELATHSRNSGAHVVGGDEGELTPFIGCGPGFGSVELQEVRVALGKLNDAIESGVIPINTVCPCGLYHGTPSVELDKEVGRLVSEPFGRRGGLGDFGRKVRKSTADERKWYLVTQGEDSVHEIAEWRVLECLEFVDDECHSNPVLSGGLTEFPEDLSELAISVYGAAGSTNRRALAHNLQAPTPLG
jgi:hypothetical protein